MAAIDQLRCDVLVGGGGPAGLAAAIALRLRGLGVTVVDAARPPIDKACGEGILPEGVDALRRLGVKLSAADGFPIRGIRCVEGDASVEAAFSSGLGLGLRRTRLHALLTDRAMDVGVQFLWGSNVCDVLRAWDGIWFVGADGQQSLIRRDAELERTVFLVSRFGFRRHYRLSPWTDMVEVYWGSRFQLYVTPLDADEIGVAILSRDPNLRLDGGLAEFPELERKLRAAKAATSERGALTTTRFLRRVFRGRTVLIGDASGSTDAIAGAGLTQSFVQAFKLADALARGDPRAYQVAHRRLMRSPAMMASLLLLLARTPRLRRTVWRALAIEPSLWRLVLSGHAASGHA